MQGGFKARLFFMSNFNFYDPVSVIFTNMKTSTKRWRLTWAAHCRTFAEHGLRFCKCAGGINHFDKMPIDLSTDTIELIQTIERYSKNYEEWIKSGAVKNPDKFLPPES